MTASTGKRTPLYQSHVAAGAKLVDFGGWDMPLHYGSQIDEHHAVRSAAGLFDVSHMTVVDVTGSEARAYLRRLLANDVDRLTAAGKGLYSCMLNEQGGVIDDLIVYLQGEHAYRVIVNAATRDTDLQWMQAQTAGFDVTLTERTDLAMLAVQGPAARERAASVLPGELGAAALQLGSFESLEVDGVFVARTGYTGEDGWEILIDNDRGTDLWDALVEAGLRPCGLGARDTLRLEAGLNLYGQDMTAETHPLESNLAWTVALQDPEREFVGRAALETARADGVTLKLVGLVLNERGVMRMGQTVHTGAGDGEITSGGFSPTLDASIALARVPAGAEGACEVSIRNKTKSASIVKPPFVKQGQIMIDRGESA